MIFAIIAGLAAGLTIGFVFDVSYPTEYSFYIAMALLAAIDSLIGAARGLADLSRGQTRHSVVLCRHLCIRWSTLQQFGGYETDCLG